VHNVIIYNIFIYLSHIIDIISYIQQNRAKKNYGSTSVVRKKLDYFQSETVKFSLSMAGWEGYAKMANTYNFRKRVWNEVNSMVRP